MSYSCFSSSLASINHERRLYVINCAGGYSSYGFDVLEGRIAAVESFLNMPLPTLPRGTPERFGQWELLAHLAAAHSAETKERTNALLTPALIGHEGERIEAIYPDGTRHRFYVGKSTGWMPCHLEIARRNSSGGAPVWWPEGTQFTVIGKR